MNHFCKVNGVAWDHHWWVKPDLLFMGSWIEKHIRNPNRIVTVRKKVDYWIARHICSM